VSAWRDTLKGGSMPRRLLVLFVSLAAVLALAPGALAGPKMELGMQDDDLFVPQYGLIFPLATGLDRTQALNVSWIRTQVVWARAMTPAQSTATKPPKTVTWNFQPWDRLIAAARQRGNHVEITLTGPAPAWAAGNHKVGVFRPNAARYATFVKAAVKHFRTRVKRYSLWNEPNWIGWLAPVKEQPKLYRALYVSAYKAARKQSPKAQILMGETSAYHERGLATAPLALLRGVLCVNKKYKRVKVKHKYCAPLSADGYAVHPYDPDHAPNYKFPGSDNVTIGTLSHLTATLDRLQKAKVLKVRGAKRMPVYLTEFGYRLAGKHGIPEARRKKYLIQAYKIAQRNARVRQMLYFQLVEPPPGPHDFWQAYLVKPDNTVTSSYTALRAWALAAAKKHQIVTPRPF
jgi:hypothetical protein